MNENDGSREGGSNIGLNSENDDSSFIDTRKYYLDAPILEKSELIRLFNEYDIDQKGGIDSEEMHHMVRVHL